jgi:dCMP deaminase
MEYRGGSSSLEEFIGQHDQLLNAPLSTADFPSSILAKHPQTDFRRVMDLATIRVCNNFADIQGLYAYLDQLDLLDGERLRPGWDTYFMVS